MRFHPFLSQTYILWRRYVWCTKGFKFGWPGDKGGRIKTVREDRVREDKVREDKGGRIHKVRDLCVYKIEVQITDPYKICIKTISFAQDKDI